MSRKYLDITVPRGIESEMHQSSIREGQVGNQGPRNGKVHEACMGLWPCNLSFWNNRPSPAFGNNGVPERTSWRVMRCLRRGDSKVEMTLQVRVNKQQMTLVKRICGKSDWLS